MFWCYVSAVGIIVFGVVCGYLGIIARRIEKYDNWRGEV